MSKEFIPYQEALELKELGFNETCFGKYDVYGVFDHKLFYHNHDVETEYVGCSAPLYQQAFRWFREKYRKVDYPEFDYDEQKWHCHSDYKGYVLFNTYEEAELACLEKLIEIVKENKQ
jgi:hypothetical protein